MLKHVHISPYRGSLSASMLRKADTVSLNSTMSFSSLSQEPLSSRSSSYTSLHEHTTPQTTTLKVYARCLRPDIEYKTLCISYTTTCKDLVNLLLNKYRMKHRDPNLFYLTMEVAVRKTGTPIRTIMVLDDEARPAELQSCHPRGDSRFALQMRRGGLVRVYDGVLMAGSQYKSLLLSDHTTVDELIQLVLNCYSSRERMENFSIYEVSKHGKYERKLHPDDVPLRVQQRWASPDNFMFLLKRNPDLTRSVHRRRLPWTKSLDLSPSSVINRDDPRSKMSTTIKVQTPSYNDYENYFYI